MLIAEAGSFGDETGFETARSNMTYETGCGRCDGRLRVEPHVGQVICPHCGTRLAVPEDPAALGATSKLAPIDDAVLEGETGSVFDSAALRSADEIGGIVPVPSSIKAPDFSRWGKGDSSVIRNDGSRTNPLGLSGSPTWHAGELPDPPAVPADRKNQPNHDAAPRPPAQPVEASPPARKLPEPLPRTPAAGVSRHSFLFLLVYASAVTAVCLGLAYFLLTNRQHQLESLPDVVPPRNEDGTITRIIAPATAPLPAGHVLSLGDTQRYGDLKVTPLRMVREPLEFVHFHGTETREPAGDVLKLWLRFENVSEDGTAFVPLDAPLLFYRAFDTATGNLKANNFIAVGDRSAESLLPIFDQPISSDWDLAGQNLGTRLEPGESIEMYVPSETEPPADSGPMTWRIHLRKGIAANGWGVTTLIEVKTQG